jgi:hypothetical protein
MRSTWVPLSASALVIGAMCLVLGSVLNPSETGSSGSRTLAVVNDQGFRWLAMATMYTLASLALTMGMPAVVLHFEQRGRRLGMVAAAVFSIGAVGTCGYAALLVFFRAMVVAGAVRGAQFDQVSKDRGLLIFLYGWIGCFYLGVLLIAIALLVARTTARWVPVLMIVFVALLPFSANLGRVGVALQVMALAVAFTGIAVEAVTRNGRHSAARPARL